MQVGDKNTWFTECLHSLYIKEYNSEKITLEFGNVKVVNSENEDDAVTLNGTLIFDYTEL